MEITKATCNGCGDCCRRITLGSEKDPIQKMLGMVEGKIEASESNLEDARFILEHWHIFDRSNDLLPVFACDQFNEDKGQCESYETRPPVCRGFPWYGKEVDQVKLTGYSRCSYWADVVFNNMTKGS